MLGERQEAKPDLLDAVQEAGKDRLEALAEPGLAAFAEPEADEYDEVEENVHVELMPVKQELQQEQNVKEDTSASSSNVKQEVQLSWKGWKGFRVNEGRCWSFCKKCIRHQLALSRRLRQRLLSQSLLSQRQSQRLLSQRLSRRMS